MVAGLLIIRFHITHQHSPAALVPQYPQTHTCMHVFTHTRSLTHTGQLFYQSHKSHKIFTMNTEPGLKHHSPIQFESTLSDSSKPTRVYYFMWSALNQSELEMKHVLSSVVIKNMELLLGHLASSCQVLWCCIPGWDHTVKTKLTRFNQAYARNRESNKKLAARRGRTKTLLMLIPS